MKRTISVWACLMLCSVIHLSANTANPGTPRAAAEKKEVKEISLIPDRVLDLEIIQESGLLQVNLSGENALLDWIIFQPKGAVVSRISTDAKIDEIKISNLKRGSYVLMVKDADGRILYKKFEKA